MLIACASYKKKLIESDVPKSFLGSIGHLENRWFDVNRRHLNVRNKYCCVSP